MTEPDTVFYALRAHQLQVGMSTDDGQDIIDVTRDGVWVLYHVYTPRPDDPEQDAENRCGPDARMDFWDAWVGLAVFPDTEVDGRISTGEDQH